MTSSKGPRSRRLGHRRDHRPADEVRQDRRHRRSRPLPDARSAEGHLQRLGARLRAGRFAEGRGRRPVGRSTSPRTLGANAAGGGAVLPGRLLVVAAAACPTRASSRHRPDGQRHLAEHAQQARVAAAAEVGRLLGVSSARQQGDARDSRRSSARSRSSVHAWERRVQSGQAGGNMISGLNALGRERALACSPTGPIALPPGEVPPAPPRPQGLERNVVITHVGLGRSEGVSARRGLDRSPQPDGQRQRAGLRRARAERRLPAGARSGAAHDEPGPADRPRSEHAARRRRRCRRRRRTGAAK